MNQSSVAKGAERRTPKKARNSQPAKLGHPLSREVSKKGGWFASGDRGEGKLQIKSRRSSVRQFAKIVAQFVCHLGHVASRNAECN